MNDFDPHYRTTFSDFAAKNNKDLRFKAIEKMKEREAMFNEFMMDFRKHEKERLKARDDKVSILVSLGNNLFEVFSTTQQRPC